MSFVIIILWILEVCDCFRAEMLSYYLLILIYKIIIKWLILHINKISSRILVCHYTYRLLSNTVDFLCRGAASQAHYQLVQGIGSLVLAEYAVPLALQRLH